MRHIVAMGGGGFSTEPENPLLDDYILGLARRQHPRVCFIPTASGDSEGYIERFHGAFSGRAEASELALFRLDGRDLRTFVLNQDVIYVGGGSTVNLLALWRIHGLDLLLKEANQAGVVLAGISAGALCWFEGGVTDSYGPLRPLHDGLGLLRGSFCPHFDTEPERPAAFHAAVGQGLPAGLAASDGAAAHFSDGVLRAAVTSHPQATLRRVEWCNGRILETPLPTRYLG
jgi:dipeptidase E